MFDKLITLSYPAGTGGEFFATELTKYITKEDNPDFRYNPRTNAYEYNQVDLLYKFRFEFILNFLLRDYTSVEEYFFKKICGGDYGLYEKYPIDAISNNFFKNIKKNFKIYVEDDSIPLMLNNIKNVVESACYDVYGMHLLRYKNNYIVNSFNFPKNKYNFTEQDLFKGSKNILLYCNKEHETFFNLLKFIKNFENYFLKLGGHSPSLTFHFVLNYDNNYFDYSDKESHFSINVSDLYFNNLKIDKEISNFLNQEIKLDYDNIYRYAEANKHIVFKHFNYKLDQAISKEETTQLFKQYVEKTYNVTI